MPAIKVVAQKILKLSFSRAKVWKRCHKQYDYRYNQKLRKRRPPAPRIRGSIIHDLLDASLQSPQAVREVVKKFEKKYGKLFKEEREEYGDPIFEGQDILHRYRKVYKDDGLTYEKVNGRNSEIPVEIPMTKTIHFFGKIDRMPRDEKNRLWVSDTKSVKKIPDEETRFSDIQTVLYIWAVLQMGLKPAGVMWDYIRTKVPTVPDVLKAGGLSKRANIDTTWDVYLTTILENKLDPKNYQDMHDLLKDKEQDFFRRIFLPYNKAMVQEVFEDMLSVGQQIEQFGKEWNDRNLDKFGCKMCEYQLLCSAELRNLDSDFIRRTEYETKERDDASEISKAEED